MTENFANTYQTTLAADLTAAATTLTVASGTGAPAPQFRLLVESEIVLVTAVAGVTYSVTRGVEGTVAAQHLASTPAVHVVTAGALAQVRADATLVIQDEGVALSTRGALNFVGPALTVTDDSVGNRSVVTLPTASPTVEGSLAPADKAKLDGVAAGAQVNVLEGVTGSAPIVAGALSAKSQALSITAATGTAAGSMSAADKGKLDAYPATPGIDGHAIQDEGTSLAQRAALNFAGPALTVTDDSAGNRSVVTLPAATASVPGSMSAADYAKLAGYPALPALVAVARTVVGVGGVASISFASIPAGYRDLQLRLIGRGTAAANNVDVYIQFNGDTTANYDQQYQGTQGTIVAATETLATATPFLGSIAGANAIAGGMGVFVTEIANYGGAWRKSANAKGSVKQADAASGLWHFIIAVGWRSTAAITSILIAPASGLFVENTVAVLYGVRDA